MRSSRTWPWSSTVVTLAVLAAVLASCSSGGGRAADTTSSSVRSTEPATDGPPDEALDDGPVDDVELASEAYVAGYPLVVSTRTLQRLGGLLGVNQLFWQTELSGPQSRTVVAPNRDTLYSVAVIDLRQGPLVLTLPDVTDRYFTYQFLDVWTESFAYIGTRTTGGRGGSWVVAPPGWSGSVPEGAEVLEATTPQVFLLGRYLVEDEADVDNVLAIRDQASLEPLDPSSGPAPDLGAPLGTPQDIPTDASFFDELGAALAVNPPVTAHDEAIFERVRHLGIGPGLRPSEEADAETLEVLAAGAAAGAERLTGAADERRAAADGGFAADLDVGRYGDDVWLRALVARIGWGANVPEEAVYPVARTDDEGRPLDGANTYRITFPDDPPVDAFWSLSVYGPDFFFAPHPSDRYTIGDRTPGLVRGDDGSIEITLSHEPPDDPSTNWLPVPEGPFVLWLRLYLPGDEILEGRYEYPAIERR